MLRYKLRDTQESGGWDEEHTTLPKGSRRRNQLSIQPLPPSATFITCKLNQSSTKSLLSRLSKKGLDSVFFSETKPEGRAKIEQVRKVTRSEIDSDANIDDQNVMNAERDKSLDRSSSNPASINPVTTPNRKSILKTNGASPSAFASTSARRQSVRRSHSRSSQSKRVSLNHDHVLIHRYSPDFDATVDEASAVKGIDGLVDSREQESERGGISDVIMSDQNHRPSLKLKLSTNNLNNTTQPPSSTPHPQSAVRTPSIKLNLGKKPSISTTSTPATKKAKSTNPTPSSGKKRKRVKQENESEIEGAPPPQRRLTLKTSAAPTKTPVTPGPVFRLKTKGKIPKRQPGVGYDSELEDREQDPVTLEGFVLRMQPGPDSNYIQNAIQNGTIGVHRAQGGADIRIRCLDTNGRRGVMIVNGNQYATTVVDLPCIIEGMKSWDKKAWIKSLDISQMMIVLGPCTSDDEAKNYPLPSDVDPKTFAYAHGVTAPMKWVRKRRFARTRRARVDDIESIERKVNALLEADAKALSTSFELFDRDPRVEKDQYSEVEEDYDEDEDDEDEEDQDAEGDDYFSRPNGGLVETPVEMDTHVDQDQIDELEAMFNEDEEEGGAAPTTNGHPAPKPAGSHHLHAPDPLDSSVAVTSASASPSASAANTAAPTPAADANPASSDDDDDDDDDDEASDRSDSEKDADDNLQQVKDRIADMENKIKEQTELLKRTTNAILKKKLARKIGELRDDVRMMRVQNGLAAEGDEEEEGDE